MQPTSAFLGSPGKSAGKESTCNAGDPSSIPGLGRSAGEGIGYPLQYSWAFLVAQLGKNPPAMRETWVRSLGLIPGLARYPGEGKGYPLQYSGLNKSTDCIVHRVAESDMTEWLSLSQIGKEWGIKACSTWNLPFLCHSFPSRLIFKVFWHPNNVNSEFANCNQKMFQTQAHLKPWHILRKATICPWIILVRCTGKWGLVKSAPSQMTWVTYRVRVERNPEGQIPSNVLVLPVNLLNHTACSLCRVSMC